MRPSLALFAAVALASSGNAAAQSSFAPGFDQNYLALRGGAYVPQGDAVDQIPGYKFNTGLGGEIAIGRRFTQIVAGEIALGSFSIATDEILTGYQVCDIYGCSDETVKGEARVTPFTATVKAILPMQGLDLYVLGGLGVYFVSGKETYAAAGFASQSFTASDTSIGVHFGAGAAFPMAPRWKVLLEARYAAAKARLSFVDGDYDVNLDGIQLAGGLQLAF